MHSSDLRPVARIVFLLCIGPCFAKGVEVVRENCVNNQQAVFMILSNVPPPKIGTVVEDPNFKGKMVLRSGVRKIHSAVNFEPIYSESSNGVFAFILYQSNSPPAHLADVDAKGRVNMRTGEVWIRRGNEDPLRVSPITIRARNPCISPDGRYVAFTACKLDGNGFSGNENIYLVDLSSPEFSPIVLASSLDSDGAACPLHWRGLHTLDVFVSDGPDGAKSRIETLRIENK